VQDLSYFWGGCSKKIHLGTKSEDLVWNSLVLDLVQKCSVYNNEASSFVNRGALQIVPTRTKKDRATRCC